MTMKIPLSQGKVALVDDEDYERVNKYKWFANKNRRMWRAFRRINGKNVYLHRFILNPPNNKQVDHINGDELDNRRCNLRLATNSQNQINSVKENRKNITSKYKGVSWCIKTRRWKSRISINGKEYWLGRHDIEIEAAKAYNEAAIKYFGEYARLKGSLEECIKFCANCSDFAECSIRDAAAKWMLLTMMMPELLEALFDLQNQENN